MYFSLCVRRAIIVQISINDQELVQSEQKYSAEKLNGQHVTKITYDDFGLIIV